ncbi:hypothetical protein D8674_019228 [Pyrus ussuriensis x Pyrus communis]|uniref:Uncharacterized protein n=1 Tax=Pyrus ussuriensis x Pyrus communis TaxID=2448454 RepID=A0A5N5G756_9ROSA|nr:hypothetical protein D8674_019228 [Pyrus ussuriensis x Pyrus communis]
MAAISSVIPTPHSNLNAYFRPPMVRVRTKEEDKAFLSSRNPLLNDPCVQSRSLVNSVEGSKRIFVLNASRSIYVGEKKKGHFQHSSFLAGGATIATGRLVACNGVPEAVWCYSGHYYPIEQNFLEFISFLEEHKVDLTNVKQCSNPFTETKSKNPPVT